MTPPPRPPVPARPPPPRRPAAAWPPSSATTTATSSLARAPLPSSAWRWATPVHPASSFWPRPSRWSPVLYYVLLAWLVVSAVALVNKLVQWHDYAATSPFAKPASKRVERMASYVVWAIVLVFMADRWVVGFADLAAAARGRRLQPHRLLVQLHLHALEHPQRLCHRHPEHGASRPASARSSRSS